MARKKALIVALAVALATGTARAEVSEIKITKQPGLLFSPMTLMEHHKLIEKHSKDAGVPGLKASWLNIMSGGTNNDALLSGSVDIVTSGVTNMLLLWGKTNGDVKSHRRRRWPAFQTHHPQFEHQDDQGLHVE